MRLFWSVAFGAALGGVSRFYLAGFIQQRAGIEFPVGTLFINVTGSLLLGFIMRLALESTTLSPELRVMLASGFCGGYTTFSTFSLETVLMLEERAYGRAAAYASSSVVLSVAATFAGFALASWVLALRGGR